MDDRWLSVDEIADYLGVSRDTVYNWITSRGMPAHRVGRLWKFKKEAVDAWVQSGGADVESPASDEKTSPADAEVRRKTRGKPGGGTEE